MLTIFSLGNSITVSFAHNYIDLVEDSCEEVRYRAREVPIDSFYYRIVTLYTDSSKMLVPQGCLFIIFRKGMAM
jgi:hypothetical protein